MDRRAFLLGLAATTAAVPIARDVMVLDADVCPGIDLRPGAINRVYGYGPAMEVSAVLRELAHDLAEMQAKIIDQWGATAEALVPPRLRDWPV